MPEPGGMLAGRRVLVTGGSRGIGRAVVEAAAAAGARCAVLCRRPAAATDVVARCVAAGWPAPVVHAGDVTDADACVRAVDAAAAELGGLDVVVNNAARVSGGVPDGLFTTTDELVRADVEEKVIASLRVVRAAVPYLRACGDGRVVNIGGEAAHTARHNVSSGVRNAAVVHLTHSMARELGPDGITANVVQPGVTLTADVRALLLEDTADGTEAAEEKLRRLAARQMLRRFVRPQEVADVVVFLASTASSGMTAQVLTVSGGSSAAVHY